VHAGRFDKTFFFAIVELLLSGFFIFLFAPPSYNFAAHSILCELRLSRG
jgi:hypothetical protein